MYMYTYESTIFMYIYIHKFLHICIRVYICIHIYIYTYLHMYIGRRISLVFMWIYIPSIRNVRSRTENHEITQ
jgi:hypothetical protein